MGTYVWTLFATGASFIVPSPAQPRGGGGACAPTSGGLLAATKFAADTALATLFRCARIANNSSSDKSDTNAEEAMSTNRHRLTNCCAAEEQANKSKHRLTDCCAKTQN